MTAIPFQHLVLLEPLGLLYGSSGRLLSPQALTGRAAEHFPPDSPALAGLLAGQLEPGTLCDLFTAGPFWFDSTSDQLMLPAPLTLLQDRETDQRRSSKQRLAWQQGNGELDPAGWTPTDGKVPPRKAPTGGWVALADWPKLSKDEPVSIHENPWEPVPHLHPKLRDDERVSAGDGALFLEYGISLKPGVCLAYLSSHQVPDGVYRFGGEGHLVELRSRGLPAELLHLLQLTLTPPFALITPGLWGGPKLSLRWPLDTSSRHGVHPWHQNGQAPGILTDKPRPWRHRLGAGRNSAAGMPAGRRRLSRGRWAVPAGTCYQVPGDPLPPWADWPERWFPREGFSFRQLGTALALPLKVPPPS